MSNVILYILTGVPNLCIVPQQALLGILIVHQNYGHKHNNKQQFKRAQTSYLSSKFSGEIILEYDQEETAQHFY